MFNSRLLNIFAIVCLTAIISFPQNVESAKKPATPAPPPIPVEIDPVIEEVSAKQLERILHDKNFVAVYWCKFPKYGKSNYVIFFLS